MKINSVILAILLGATVLAGSRTAEAQSADVSILALTCAGCHGRDANGSGGIPGLRAQQQDYLAAQLKAFKSGERQGTVMNRLAKGYTVEEIAGLSAHFSQLK